MLNGLHHIVKFPHQQGIYLMCPTGLTLPLNVLIVSMFLQGPSQLQRTALTRLSPHRSPANQGEEIPLLEQTSAADTPQLEGGHCIISSLPPGNANIQES